jgi:hypothetical protein
MSDEHECDFEETVEGLQVAFDVEFIRHYFPQYDERTLRILLERHAAPIAAQMVSAGLAAAMQIFNGSRGDA